MRQERVPKIYGKSEWLPSYTAVKKGFCFVQLQIKGENAMKISMPRNKH